MASKNNPGKYDCYENAHPDEPMFVLLGRDPAAGALVRVWVDVREQRGEEPEKLEEARRCAVALDAWAVSIGKAPIALEIKQDELRVSQRASLELRATLAIERSGTERAFALLKTSSETCRALAEALDASRGEVRRLEALLRAHARGEPGEEGGGY